MAKEELRTGRWGAGPKRVREARARRGPRRCIGCAKNIDHRGRKSVRCEDCARIQALKWRRRYDAEPGNVRKRRQYGANPKNVRKARFRRNTKTYLLGLCIKLLRLQGFTLDQALRDVRGRIRSSGIRLDSDGFQLQVKPEGRWVYPWTTMRGRAPRKRRRAGG